MNEAELRRGALGILRELQKQADDGDAQEEHVIVVCDPRLGREHAIGVYPNRATALAELVREREEYLRADPEFADLQYKVIPMFRGMYEKDSP